IAQLLSRCGYGSANRVYVSCEYGKSKHEGTFLPHIAQLHKIRPDRILHIGDNKHGDVLMAGKAGCTAIHLAPAPLPPEPVIPCGGEQPFYIRAASSAIHGILRKQALTGNPQMDPWERLGFNVFGPLFTGFLLWLSTMVKRSQPEKILLFARDTHIIKLYL